MKMTACAPTVAFAALAVLAQPASAEVLEVRWPASGEVAHEFRVAPGKFAEWCAKLQRGEKVQWRFESPAPLDFNVHFHEGKEVRFPVKQAGVARAEGTLDVDSDQDYCWMWTNKTGGAVALRATLAKGR